MAQTYTALATGATPSFGTQGKAVAALQTQLNTQNAGKAGYTPLNVDGKYGALTQAAANFKPSTTTAGAGANAGAGGAAPITDPAKVGSATDANNFINSGQKTDFDAATATNGDNPPVKDSTASYEDMFNKLKRDLAPSTPAPAPLNQADTYNNLRATSGINDLESQLTDLKSQAKAITDVNTNQTLDEQGKPVAMNVIDGRISEEERQANERLTPINEQIQNISDQLTTKYNVVNNLMTYGKQDYDSAVASYDKQFSDNIALMSAVKTLGATDNTAVDNARANLQIIYNNLGSGATDATSLSPDEKANITKLETQAGLPVGFYSSIAAKNADGTILSTTTRDDGGTKYADVITKGADGKISVQSYAVGSATTKTSTSKNQANDVASAVLDFEKQIKDKGWAGANPDAYDSYKSQLVSAYGASAGLALDAAMKTAGITVDTDNK